ncbi:MAG: hypothetical protein P1V20_03520 [Verrucomicrobiales bacterium]|nr:hypothetical protein [Verrucomicrobiales bacterium]
MKNTGLWTFLSVVVLSLSGCSETTEKEASSKKQTIAASEAKVVSLQVSGMT